MAEKRVRVTIFGNQYHIQGDADPEYILHLADYVNERMEEVCHNISSGNTAQIAILAALNIADEYFQLKEKKAYASSELERKAENLISLLDDGIIGDVFSRLEMNR